jgi:hypothetical protein
VDADNLRGDDLRADSAQPNVSPGDVRAGDLRAGDADRERVAERLRLALDEGRLNLYEYDERLRDTYASKTYAELDRVLADLPLTASTSRSQVVPASAQGLEEAESRWRLGPDGRYVHATRWWLAEQWGSWARANGICLAIWGGMVLLTSSAMGFWPIWVAGPWGIVLLARTVSGLTRGEPQHCAGRQVRKAAEKAVRRQAKRAKELSP